MAISFKGFIDGAQDADPAATCTVDLTASLDTSTGGSGGNVAEGDFVLLLAYGCDTIDVSCSWSTPSGLGDLGEMFSNDNRDTNTLLAYKIMGSTPDTTAVATVIQNSTRSSSIVAMVFTGVDSSTPIDVTTTTSTGNNSANMDCASITPSTVGAWVLAIGAATVADTVAAGTPVTTYPSGYTALWSTSCKTTPYDAMAAASYMVWSSGTEDPGTYIASGSNSSQSWLGYTVALRPAAGGGAQSLTPSLFTETNTFYAPTVSFPAQSLTPSLFSNSNTFYAPTVHTTYGLTPALFSETNTFYSPLVTQGAQFLTPALFTETNTFYSATISVGAVTLTPSLFSEANTFYPPTVSPAAITLTPALFSETNVFYSPTVTALYGLSPALFSETNVFYSPTVVLLLQELLPTLFNEVNTFYSPVITGGAHLTLLPSLMQESVTFFDATVSNRWNLLAVPSASGFVDIPMPPTDIWTRIR